MMIFYESQRADLLTVSGVEKWIEFQIFVRISRAVCSFIE